MIIDEFVLSFSWIIFSVTLPNLEYHYSLLFTKVPPWETLKPREKAIYQDNKDLYSRTARKGGKNLLFARSATENETWLPLLEKAYAKLNGGQNSILLVVELKIHDAPHCRLREH